MAATPRLIPLGLITLFALATTALVLAADPSADDHGFTTLFNGKDTAGWVYGDNKAGKGYQVENGVLFCTEKDGGNLYTEKEYADFVFRFDFKLEDGSNNGIGIRAPLKGDAAYVGM